MFNTCQVLYTCVVVVHMKLLMTPWTAGFPILHCLLKFARTNVHWFSDTIQKSHPCIMSVNSHSKSMWWRVKSFTNCSSERIKSSSKVIHLMMGKVGKQCLGSFHCCAYLIQLAQDHSKDGVELTDMCARRGIFCPGCR